MEVTKMMTLAVALIVSPVIAWAQYDISDGPWKITFDGHSKTVSYVQYSKEVVKGAYVEIHKSTKIHDSKAEKLLSTSYPTITLAKTAVNDEFGTAT